MQDTPLSSAEQLQISFSDTVHQIAGLSLKEPTPAVMSQLDRLLGLAVVQRGAMVHADL